MPTADSQAFTITSLPITLSNAAASNVSQAGATLSVTTNSIAGTLYFAVRTDRQWTQSDAALIIGGGSDWAGTITPPAIGDNTIIASGLGVARTQYLGVVQSDGTSYSAIATAEFLTITYPTGHLAPYQLGPYPEQSDCVGLPINLDLKYGWGGDEPMTLAVQGLMMGLSATDAGVVTGTPMDPGLMNIQVTATNAVGSANGVFTWGIYTPMMPAQAGMTRKEMLDTVVAYADRYSDTEVLANLDKMLIFAEHRMSRIMRNREMSTRHLYPVYPGTEWYALPADFAGMRDIKIIAEGSSYALNYVAPMSMNPPDKLQYSIQANRLRVYPWQDGDIEITYYQRVPELKEDDDTNWVLQYNSDIYQIAMQSQIEIFVKEDARAAALDAQLVAFFAELDGRDKQDGWSGTPLQIVVA